MPADVTRADPAPLAAFDNGPNGRRGVSADERIMDCPYCGFHFKAFLANAAAIPELAPLVCEDCGEVSLLISGIPRRMTSEELVEVRKSPAWAEVIGPAREVIFQQKIEKLTRRVEELTAQECRDVAAINLLSTTLTPAPVDRSARVLTDGSPVTADHREINPATGQQRGYIVLSAEERAKGFVRPVRRTYTHVGKVTDLVADDSEVTVRAVRLGGCGTETTMGLAIAETYARDPEFYSGTFCCYCKVHRPLDEFVWKGTMEQVGS